MRDYDKDPIVIRDYSTHFGNMLFIFLILLSIYFYEYFRNPKFFLVGVVIFLCIILYWTFKNILRIKDNNEKMMFKFTNSNIEYFCKTDRICIKGDAFDEGDLACVKKIAPKDKIEEIGFCYITELDRSYGRLNFSLSYKKSLTKRWSSIEIGEIFLFLKFLLDYLFLALPFRIYTLKKTNQPLSLIRKNLFIRFKNRNYFVVNIYSQKDLDDLLLYFKDIKMSEKIRFIPHIQNFDAKFANDFWDKNERWSEDFDDTYIPEENFKRKLRRFLSLE